MQSAPQETHTRSVNPATAEPLAQWPLATPAQVEQSLAAAHRAAREWRATPVAQRALLLRAVAAQLRQHKAALARQITLEMGKPLAEAEAEVEKSAWNCEYVAEHGPGWLDDEKVATSARHTHVSYLPLGVVLTILPWNFPVWQIFRCVASALLAGNVSLIKHAPNVQGCATQVAALLRAAGLPDGVYTNLHAEVADVGRLIADPRVAAVTLTGSPRAGAAVAAQAGAACKKSILELGGSDPFIVLADADLDAAVAAGIRGRYANCGQVCLAAKRFIIEAPVAQAFAERFAAAAAALRLGDPLQPGTQLGPMARGDLRDELHRQVSVSLGAGARLLTGGRAGAGPGWFYEPTVLTDVTPQMPVVAQETFGPVAALQTARDADHAVAMANDSPFGLSAIVWSRDTQRAQRMARTLEAGSVFINAVTASDPRVPVGGVKLSGYGRELGRHGMRELCNVQTVWVG